MKIRLILAFLAAVPVLAVAGLATAGGQSDLADVREATAAYHDIDAARSAGYTVELPQTDAFGGGTCIADLGGSGAMGIHLVSEARIDGVLDATDPEVLLYERRNDGTLKLTGVEYVVGSESQPELFGQKLAETSLARYGIDATVWTLHAWIWKPNPAGILTPWNSRVSCDG